MKKIFIAFIAVACAFSACSDDDTADDLSRAAISITPDAIPAGIDGTTAQVTVTSSGDWRLAGVCDWVHPSAEAGKNGDVVTFTIDPNTTEGSREAVFKFFVGSAVAPLKIMAEEGYALDIVSEESVTIEASGTDFQVKLQTNIPELTYAFSDGGSDWVSFESRKEAFGNTVLNFTVTKNPDYDDRSTVLTISGLGRSVDIPITQRQIDAVEIDRENLEFDLSERTISVAVTSNVDYKVTIDGDWITQEPQTRGLETEDLKFHLASAPISRGGKITISGSGITKVVSIIQKDPDAVAAIIPDEAFRSWLSEQNWILDLGNSICLVMEAGMTATELTYNPGWSDVKFKSLEGVAAFPELTKIDVSRNSLTSIDLTGLTKVSALVCEDMDEITYVNMGANPITEFSLYTGTYDYVYIASLTIAGEKLVSLNLMLGGYMADYDRLESVDVSGCPALETLDCRRGPRLTTLYLKTGQVIPNLTKRETTAIVYK